MKFLRTILLALALGASGYAMAAKPATLRQAEQQEAEERLAPDAQPAVRVDSGIVELRVGEGQTVKFEIFSITGQLIKSVNVKAPLMKIDLPKGFYIIKCESWTKRVMLK